MADRTILDFVDRVLPDTLQGDSWAAWRAVLAAVFALPMDDADLEVFEALTGDSEPPSEPVSELWAVCGRRGGKSLIAALIAVYLATCRTYNLARGERGWLPVVAADRRQARVIRDYVVGILQSTPVLEQLIDEELKESIELSTGVTIEVATASHRTIRGRTVVGAVCDEIAFWPTDDSAADPDRAILDALRPAMATVPGSLLLCLSTPYARRGELYKAATEEQPDDVLVIRADSATMNPGIDSRVIERAFERDPTAAMSEFGRDGEICFRADVAALLSEDALAAVVAEGVVEVAPIEHYKLAKVPRAHFDAATGSGKDSAALAVAYEPIRAGFPAELACIRQWKPPFSPSAVVAEAADLARSYGVREVQIDRFAPGLVQELFRESGARAKVSERDTSATFVELLSLVNSERVKLLDHPALLSELRRLERRSRGGGRDRVGHPPGGHDDVAAAAAGALVACVKTGGGARPMKRYEILM